MSLCIDDENVLRMAAELAAIRGVSVAVAVEDAIRSALAVERTKETPEAKTVRLVAWVKGHNSFRESGDLALSSDHSWLYDENGLPR